MGRKEQIFGSQMNCLLERAKKQKNVVELQEIKEVFQKGSLTPAQLEGIVSYHEERKIDVLTMSEIDSDEIEQSDVFPEEVEKEYEGKREDESEILHSERGSAEDPVYDLRLNLANTFSCHLKVSSHFFQGVWLSIF